MKGTSSKVNSFESRPGHSSLGSSFKSTMTATNSDHNMNNGGVGASRTNTSNNCDTEVEAEDTMIVKREGVLVTDLLYRLHRRSTKLVDTHVICMDGYIPVHRCVLMACSNFLLNLLIQEDPAELAAICLPDFKVSQVIPLINSFYTGCVTFNKSDLNTTLELISMLKTDPVYNFQPAKDQDKKWSPKMRHYLENKEVNSETQSAPGGSSSKHKVFEKPSMEAADGEKSNQSFVDNLSPNSVDNGTTIEVDIEEIDDPEFPPDANEESDDDIKILEILSAEPVISDVTEVADISFTKSTSIGKSNISNAVVQVDDESSNEPYDEYVFSPTDVDLATNVIVRQSANPTLDDDNDDDDKDPLELESLVFDKDFVEVHEDFHGRSYEFETIAFDESGQHKQIAQILTEPVPLTHTRTDFAKPPRRRNAPKAKKSRTRGRKKTSSQLKRLLAFSDTPPPLLFEENILGSATPPHLRRKSFEKLEEQKSRMEDIRFSNQLQKQLQMSLEAVIPGSSTQRSFNEKDWMQSKLVSRMSRDDFVQPLQKVQELRHVEDTRRQREEEEALLKKFEQEKRQRDEEMRLLEEEDNQLRERRRLKEEEDQRRLEVLKRNKELSEEQERVERLRKNEEHKKDEDEKRVQEQLHKEEEAKRIVEEEKRKAEEARIKAQEAKQKEEEEARSTAEEQKRLRAEQGHIREEKHKKYEEEKHMKAEGEKRLKLEEEKRLKLEEEKRIKAEEEKRKKIQEEKRKKIQEEKRKQIQDEKRCKEEERRRKEEARLKKLEEERAHREQEERQEIRLLEEKRAAEEEALRKHRREDQKRKEAEEKRLKDERRKEKEARRKREEERRIAAEEKLKQLETEKRQQAEREREEVEKRRQEEAVRVAIQKAEEALNQQLELERKRREAEEEQRLEEQRKIQEGEDRKKREEQERLEAEKRERERIEEEKRIEEELAMQIEKDMQKFDYEPYILGMQEPKRRTEEAPTQQPKSTPFFEEFVKRKQKILEEEKRRRQAEEQQHKGQDPELKSKIVKATSESMSNTESGLGASDMNSGNISKVILDTRPKSAKSSDAEKVQEQLKSINLSVEVEEILDVSSHSHITNHEPEIVPRIVDSQVGVASEKAQIIGLNLSIMEETNSANQQVYEFVDDIPVAETEIELTGDGFAAETELETDTIQEIDVETQEVETEPQEQGFETPEGIDMQSTVEEVCTTIEPDVEQSCGITESTSETNPPSPFVGEDLSLTSSSPENGLQIVEPPEVPKPKLRLKKKKSRKVREKQTQVKPQMITVSKKHDSVIVHTAEQSRRSSRSSESNSRRSPEPISLTAAARILIQNPKKPIKVQYGSNRVTLQNPKIIISRLSNEEYKHYSFRLQRFKRMRSKKGTPPPTLTLASPEVPSTSKAMNHWKALQKDVTSSRSKSTRKMRDSIDDGPPPLLEPQLPSSSKQKRSGVTLVGIENFPAVSQPACITVNDLDWYQKELKRCAHCKKKYVTHTKASSCLLNHGFRRCLICLDLVSSLDTSYELHYSKHHSVPKHRGHVACPICGKLFLFRGLQSHVTKKHLQSHEPHEQVKTPEFHSQNLSHHFFYPPPPQEQFYNQYHANSLYQHHQYQASNTSQQMSSMNEPPIEPLVLDLKKIPNHSGMKEQPSALPVRLSESEEDEDHSEVETIDGSDDGKANGAHTGSTGSVLKDTNKEGFRNITSPEMLYAFKEPNREIPIELIPNPTTAFVDAELARRAFQQHFQVEKMPQSQPVEKPPTPVSQLTIEKTPIISERERELPIQLQPQKRTYQDCVDVIPPQKKFFPYNEPYQYDTHHRTNDDNLHLPRLPYFPIHTAPSHIPNHHHHDFFQHRPVGMHNPPYPQSHHPHMHAHLPQHQQPSNHSSHSNHSMNSMDNEFPIINPGITVDESSGSVLCELMPVNYHASPIPLQQPYNSNGPKGPSAVPAPLQDMYEAGNNVGINRPAPSIFSTPPLSSTPSSTSSNQEWTTEDTGRRHHHMSHLSSHHQNLQSHHHHHQHQQWGEPLSAHRNESVISVNMEYMKIAEMDHQHHQQHQQHSDGPVQCDRCKASFYSQDHLANHRCIYDMN